MQSQQPSPNGWINAAILQIMTTQGRIEAQTAEILRRMDGPKVKPKPAPLKVPWHQDKVFMISAGVFLLMLTGHITFDQLAGKISDLLLKMF